jgi:hypothetical protein
MENNKSVTAVEYLLNEFQKVHKDFGGLDLEWLKRFDQAKEIEKQQIIHAWENGYDHGACVNEDKDKYHGIQYYNETFQTNI